LLNREGKRNEFWRRAELAQKVLNEIDEMLEQEVEKEE
jgi:hypothetical protein